MAEPISNTTIYYLEMTGRSAFRPTAAPEGFELVEVDPPDPVVNREFYRRVGAPWRWTDRLCWSLDDWRHYVERGELTTLVGRAGDRDVGYCELEHQAAGNVQIAYFGLLPEFIGQGLGGPLLSAAIERAWRLPETRRVWVHTCTHDHVHALENYRRRGFEIFKTEQVAQS